MLATRQVGHSTSAPAKNLYLIAPPPRTHPLPEALVSNFRRIKGWRHACAGRGGEVGPLTTGIMGGPEKTRGAARAKNPPILELFAQGPYFVGFFVGRPSSWVFSRALFRGLFLSVFRAEPGKSCARYEEPPSKLPPTRFGRTLSFPRKKLPTN